MTPLGLNAFLDSPRRQRRTLTDDGKYRDSWSRFARTRQKGDCGGQRTSLGRSITRDHAGVTPWFRGGFDDALKTGKTGRYRYCNCSIKARQGDAGCKGRSIPMEQLDGLVAAPSAAACTSPRGLHHRLEEQSALHADRGGRRKASYARGSRFCSEVAEGMSARLRFGNVR